MAACDFDRTRCRQNPCVSRSYVPILRRIRVCPDPTRVPCDLAQALAARGRDGGARGVLDDRDPECPLDFPSPGFTWGDRDDYAGWLERKLAPRDRKGAEEAVQPER